MSEKFTPRAADWDAKKREYEEKEFVDAVYGEAGETDFSEEAHARVLEGDAYAEHMSKMSERSDDYDPIETEQLDSIDRMIQADPQLRRMVAVADLINEASRNGEDTSEREDKLQELMVNYQADGTAHDAEKDEIFARIIDRTRAERGNDTDKNADESTTPSHVENASSEMDAEESSSEHDAETPSPENEEDYRDEETASALDAEAIRAKRAKMVAEGLGALQVGNMSDEQVDRYNLIEKESNSSDESDSEGDEADNEISASSEEEHDDYRTEESIAMLDDDELESKRAKMAAEGIETDELSDDEVNTYNLVESDTASRKPGRRSARQVMNNLRRPGGAAAEMTAAFAGLKEKVVEKNPGYRRRRALGAFAALAAFGGGVLLMKTGHDIFGGGHGSSHGGAGGGIDTTAATPPHNGIETGTPQGKSGSGSKIAADTLQSGHTGTERNFPNGDSLTGNGAYVEVKSGDGEIHVLQHLLEANGLKVSAADAQRIGEHANIHDFLIGDSSYDDSYSTMDRIGGVGNFKVKPGVVEAALKSADVLGLK